jgi:hypothetical protein
MPSKTVNVWFQNVARKACPCGSNSKRGSVKHPVSAWGVYVRAKWNTVDYFCEECFATRILPRIIFDAPGMCLRNVQPRTRSGCSLQPYVLSAFKERACACAECKQTKQWDESLVRAGKEADSAAQASLPPVLNPLSYLAEESRCSSHGSRAHAEKGVCS